MTRHRKIALLWTKATVSGAKLFCPKGQIPNRSNTGCEPDPNANRIKDMSWEEFKRKNPIKGIDREDQAGVPVALLGVFDEGELDPDAGPISRHMQSFFSDSGSSESSEISKEPVSKQGLADSILHKGSSLKKGSNDSATDGLVSKVQTLLEEHGYSLPGHGVDGIFGNETEKVVIEFQRNNKESGLIESGEVDGKTLALLQSSIAKRRPTEGLAGERALSDQEARRQRTRGRTAPKVSGPGRVSSSKLYQDLMAGISYPNLCKAMVANAIAESGLYYNANGDCGSYAKSKGEKSLDTSLYPESFRKPQRGRCCSFGLWQYNICGGLGNSLLGGALRGSDYDKIAILTSYDKQVRFMISHVNRKIASIKSKENRSVDFWVDWFVRKVERPKNMDRAVSKRRQIAKGLTLV